MTSSMQKTALVTGAAQRIGRALAYDLAQQGWDVALHYHTSASEAAVLCEEIKTLGCRACILQADLRDARQALKLIRGATESLGPLTCLINNAALFHADAIPTISLKTWEDHFNLNMRAPLILTQEMMRLAPLSGDMVVINMLDQMAISPSPHYASYSLSKQGLWSLTERMALAYAPRLRINGIALGLVLSGANQSSLAFEALYHKAPLRKPTSLAEVTQALQLILKSPSMTGTILTLDSGYHLKR